MTDYGEDDIDEIFGFHSLREIIASDSAMNHDWSTKKAENVKVTLDGARFQAWTKAKAEIRFVRERVRHLMRASDGSSVAKLLNLIFGEESDLWITFSRRINVTHDMFLRFLGVAVTTNLAPRFTVVYHSFESMRRNLCR